MSPLDRATVVYSARGLGLVSKAVLLCLAHHDGPEGARPTVALLADEVGAKIRATRLALRDLEKQGLILREDRGPNRPAYYRPQYEAIRALSTLHHMHPAPHAPCTTCTPTRHHMHPYPAPHAAEPGIEQETNQEDLSSTLSPPPETAPPAPEPPAPEPEKPRKEKPEDPLWQLWRGYHHRASATPTREQTRALAALRREAGSDEDAALLLEWAHTSEDQWARRLRGIEPWPDGTLITRLDLASLSRSVEGRLAQARAWEDRGRTAAPTLRPRTNSAPPGRGARAAAALQEYLDPPTILDVEVSCRQSQKLLLS